MATKFVNSGAGGANNGTSWTDAWVSAASSNGVAAGDVVKVHKTHSETTLGSSITWSNGTVANPVRIVCVDKDNSDVLATGAAIGWNGDYIGLVGNIYSYGITWSSSGTGGPFLGGSTVSDVQIHEGGTIAASGSFSMFQFQAGDFKFINETIDLSAAGSGTLLRIGAGGVSPISIEWFGGEYKLATSQTSAFSLVASGYLLLECRGVKFTGTCTNLFDAGSSQLPTIRFADCVPPTYTNIFGTAPAHPCATVFAERFATGTITVPDLAPKTVYTKFGTVNASLARYRTGGADDGVQANAYSWEMAAGSGVGAFACPLIAPPITRWVAAGSQTVTVYVASGGSLNNDEFWIEAFSPSEAGSATALAKVQSTRTLALASPAALTTDGVSTWNGTGVGTKQKVSVSIAPTIAGPLIVRCYLAKNVTAYIDPKLDVS